MNKRNTLAVQHACVFMCGLAHVNKYRSILFVDHGCFNVINDYSLVKQDNWMWLYNGQLKICLVDNRDNNSG